MLRLSNRLSWVSIAALMFCLIVPASVQGQWPWNPPTPQPGPSQGSGKGGGGVRGNAARLDMDSRGGDDEETPINIPVPVAGGFAVQRLLDDVRGAAFVPEQLYDPAFNRYVDFGLLAQAWNEKDPALLTDVALQLAEGERILLRTHRAISADKLFELATRAAIEKNDKAALARLAKVFEKSGKDKLKAQLSSATKLAGASRAADPMAMVSVHEMTPGTYAIYQDLVKRVQAARIGGNRDLLKDVEQETNNAVELSDKQREYLLKIMSSARAEIPETAKPDPSIELLDKLGDGSRAWGSWPSSANFKHVTKSQAFRNIAKSRTSDQRTKHPSSGGRAIQPAGTLAIQRNLGTGQGHTLPKVRYIRTNDGRIIKATTGPNGMLILSH